MLTVDDLPEDFKWVDLSDSDFNDTLEACLKTQDNLMIQAKAGCGKSLIIKILSKKVKNIVVLSTTGATAFELSSDNIAAKTIHSFFMLPPKTIFETEDLFITNPKSRRALAAADLVIIDEVSMMMNSAFDHAVNKMAYTLKGYGKQVPRIILFGDMFQLPPIRPKDELTLKYFEEKYDGKFMFFNSHAYTDLNFKMKYLHKSYRQADAEFAENIYKLGIGTFDQSTLDFFNSKVMPLATYQKDHDSFVYLASTNKIVDKLNEDYLNSLEGEERTYVPTLSSNWPRDKFPINEVTLRVGAQAMITANSSEGLYQNGTVGKITQFDDKGVWIKKSNGELVHVDFVISYLYEAEVNNAGEIIQRPTASAMYLPCRLCKAMTIHKSQGKTLDAAYLALNGWNPEGLIYVAISRLTSLDGLGMSRRLTKEDISVNQEVLDYIVQRAMDN